MKLEYKKFRCMDDDQSRQHYFITIIDKIFLVKTIMIRGLIYPQPKMCHRMTMELIAPWYDRPQWQKE